MDPRTGEYVGQVLQDFRTEPLYEALADSSDRTGTGFPILITVVDDSGGDTVVAPGFSLADGVSKPISEVLLPLDTKCQESECSSHLAQFGDIVKSMKHGDSGITTFSRKTNFSEEIVYMSYAPVIVNSKRPVDVSDFSRGVISSDYLVYSLAFAETESVILESFEQSENNMERQIRISIGILSAVITAAALIVIYVSHRTTMSITEPMLYLLDLIRSMNRYANEILKIRYTYFLSLPILTFSPLTLPQ